MWQSGSLCLWNCTVGERSVIPDNVKIGKNTAISGVTTPEDYPNGELAGGQ